MPQDLIFVENLDGHVLPGLEVLRELHLREGPLPESPAELVLPHPRPPHRAHPPPPPRPQATRIPGAPSRATQDRFLLQGCQTHNFTVFTAAPIAPLRRRQGSEREERQWADLNVVMDLDR